MRERMAACGIASREGNVEGNWARVLIRLRRDHCGLGDDNDDAGLRKQILKSQPASDVRGHAAHRQPTGDPQRYRVTSSGNGGSVKRSISHLFAPRIGALLFVILTLTASSITSAPAYVSVDIAPPLLPVYS